jgi:hypothetical protein
MAVLGEILTENNDKTADFDVNSKKNCTFAP